MDILKVDFYCDLPYNYTGIVDYGYCIEYYLDGLLHREDGPASIWSDGTTYYYLNGEDITKEVNNWLNGKTDIPPHEKWDNNTRLLFKLTFG